MPSFEKFHCLDWLLPAVAVKNCKSLFFSYNLSEKPVQETLVTSIRSLTETKNFKPLSTCDLYP